MNAKPSLQGEDPDSEADTAKKKGNAIFRLGSLPALTGNGVASSFLP